MMNRTEEKLTCSGFSTSVEEPLAGTAPLWEWCICIEVPLPWDTDILYSKFFCTKCSNCYKNTNSVLFLQIEISQIFEYFLVFYVKMHLR